jgi:hypothetical protein
MADDRAQNHHHWGIGEKTANFKSIVEETAKGNNETDTDWNVRIVAIPSTAKGGTPLLATYREPAYVPSPGPEPTYHRAPLRNLRRQRHAERRKFHRAAGIG